MSATMKWLASVFIALLATAHANDDVIKYDSAAVKRFQDELHRLGVDLQSVSKPDKPISRPDPVVSSAAGDFEGYWTESQFGRPIAAFQGIPYAQPPVGPLRFKLAQPLTSRLTAFKANSSQACTQRSILDPSSGIIGTEDCLYLNVYVPETVERAATERLPVIFYIHGGGFFAGFKDMYRSNVLLDKDVILVLPNYRLGPLGFLTTEDAVIPGNIGLKDQLAALHWVKENIAAFGGNPNLITVCGHSAGGASADYMSISPLAKDLIQRVLPISGTAMAPWALARPEETRENRQKAAQILGCPAEPPKQLLACLQTKTAKEITSVDVHFNALPIAIFIPFKPVVEGNIPGAYLPHHPKKLISDGPANDVPYMTGVTSEEGSVWLGTIFENATLLEDFDRRFNEVVPPLLCLSEPHQKSQTSLDTLRRVYFGGSEPFKKSHILCGANMVTDRYFLLPMIESSFYRSKGAKSPTYLWYFSYLSKQSMMKLVGLPERYGVGHGDDLFYVLTLAADLKPSPEDTYLSMIMTDLYSSFARDGVPTSPLLETQWKPVVTKSLDVEYFHIRSPQNLKMEKDLLPERWNLMKKVAETGA